MKTKMEYDQLTDDELLRKIEELKLELHNTRLAVKAKREPNVKKISQLKKRVAQIYTVLNLRKKLAKKEGNK